MNISQRKKIHIPIQKGFLKGKKVPLPPSLKGHRNFTSGLLKEALFQHIENFYAIRLDGTKKIPVAFFDLCAGSGQIGIEAYSRGMSPVHIVEKDRNRFEFLLQHLRDFQKKGRKLVFHRKDFRRLADDISLKNRAAVFIDLPYTFWKDDGSCPHIDQFFQKYFEKLLLRVGNLDEEKKESFGVVFFIQSPKPYAFPHLKIMSPDLQISSDCKLYRKHYLNIIKIYLP